MKNRSQTEIYASILEAASRGASPTHILYDSFLEWSKLRKCLSELTSSGMVELDVRRKLYKTTDKGLEFVELQRRMGKYLPPANLQLLT